MINEINSDFLKLNRDDQKVALEAILFATEEPLSEKDLFRILITESINDNRNNGHPFANYAENTDSQYSIEDEIMQSLGFTADYFTSLISDINMDLDVTGRPYKILNIAGGYQFGTRAEYGELIQNLVKSKAKRRLSQAALEALAIIAYNQPVTKPEIEQIRGVNSSDVVNSLVEKGLIRIMGRKNVLGKPLMYGTSDLFLKAFGINSLDDMPKLKELEEFTEIRQINEDKGDFTLTVIENSELLDDSDSEFVEKIENNNNYIAE